LRGSRRPFAARAGALLLSALAFSCWWRMEPGPAAFLVILLGLMALSTVVALLAPLAPRALGAAALGGTLALPVLFFAGGVP
jgi:hypothetical protein